MFREKNKTFMMFGILAIAILVCVIFLRFPFRSGREPVVITEETYYPTNNMQHEASVWLGSYNHKLYFYYKRESIWDFSGLGGYLCVLENGSVQCVHEIHGNVFAIENGLVYFNRETEDPFTHQVVVYEIASGEETVVGVISGTSLDAIQAIDCFFDEDGTIYVGCRSNDGMSYPINANTIHAAARFSKAYYYDGNKYSITRDISGSISVVCYDKDGNRHPYSNDLAEGMKSVIPCENGLLIHNEYTGKLIYYIDGTTKESKLLFSVDCDHSTSAVNVYDNYVYLSFKRYEDYDALWSGGNHDDELEGMYRISLSDFTAEKISNKVYSGLYIFDDTGIYACDEHYNIYKLDFDGNLIMTLLEH